MPHLSVEYTQQLTKEINFPELLKSVHLSLLNAPGIDVTRLKSRLIKHEQVLNGSDAHPIQMIHITLAVLSGRDAETKKTYSQRLLTCLKEFVPDSVRSSSALTVEIRDMDLNSYGR